MSTWIDASTPIERLAPANPKATILLVGGPDVDARLPLLRKVAPEHRQSRVENDSGTHEARRVSWLYGLRAVLISWDRRALAVNVHRKAANGSIVICDRYPSTTVGAMDSARLRSPADVRGRGQLLDYLAQLENRLYREMPPADVVIRLTVPVEVAIERMFPARSGHKCLIASGRLKRAFHDPG